MKTSGQNQPGKRNVKPQKASMAGGRPVRGQEQRKAGEKFREEVAKDIEQHNKVDIK